MKATILAAAAAAALSLALEVQGHGAVVRPPPRNAVDKDLAPWSGPVVKGTPSVESKTGLCPSVDENGNLTYANGQSCFCERPSTLLPCPSPPTPSPAKLSAS